MSERYQIEGLIARGGMAEVHLARMAGAAGFTKWVALKRILRAYADNAQLTAMFLDEARLAARLSHPNVVQVFDFGEGPEGYFIAMEYVPGPDLAGVLRALRGLGERPSEPAMIDVVLQLLRGLDHAHRLTGADGVSLGVIHRDVSPGNVLLTPEGAVKLSDFGVARAAERLAESTQAGKTRGKAAYMSPEQARSRPIDARSDIFSAGLVLWEALAGERCYAAEDEAALIRLAALGEVRTLGSAGVVVSPALQSIVDRALQRDPAKRFPGAAAMAEALEAYHRAAYPAYTAATGLGALVQRALAVLPPLPHLAVKAAGPAAPVDPDEWDPSQTGPRSAPLAPDPGAESTRPVQSADKPAVRRPRPQLERSPDSALAQTKAQVQAETAAAAPAAAPPKGSVLRLALVVVGAALMALAALALWDHQHDPQTTAQPVEAAAPGPVGPPPATAVTPPRAEPRPDHAVEVRTPVAESPAESPRSRAAIGYLAIKCDPWCEIYVDGKDTHYRSPALEVPVAAGVHTVRVVNPPTTLERRARVVVKSGEKVARYFNLVLDRQEAHGP